MTRPGIASIFWIAPVLGILLGLGACAGKTTPPGANINFGSLMVQENFGGSYTLLQWKEGLSISIVDDSQGGHHNAGSGSTEDPVWRGQGSITGRNGQDITWRVETTDGKTAQFFIDEQPYDLTKGTLFLIKTDSESIQVTQQQGRHSGSCTDDESCQQLLKQDPAILQFIQEILQSK